MTRREVLEHRLLDAEIVERDLATELDALKPRLLEARRRVRLAQADLDHYDYVEQVRSTFGDEVADMVRYHSRPTLAETSTGAAA